VVREALVTEFDDDSEWEDDAAEQGVAGEDEFEDGAEAEAEAEADRPEVDVDADNGDLDESA
jgi:hypothetical protein